MTISAAYWRTVVISSLNHDQSDGKRDKIINYEETCSNSYSGQEGPTAFLVLSWVGGGTDQVLDAPFFSSMACGAEGLPPISIGSPSSGSGFRNDKKSIGEKNL